MTFKIIDKPEFTIDVAVPNPGGGEQMLSTTFRGVSEEEFDGFDLMTRDGSKEALRAIVTAFHDVEIEGGLVLPHVSREAEAEAYEILLAQPAVRIAAQATYARAMMGIKGARRGN